jgi:pimeloyl-ACP methyl ester carboxylesterase
MSRPVVLVHGLSGSLHFWDATVEALEPHHEVHVVRLPGVRYREAAEWLGDWLRREGLTGATLVGHSMGGAVALLAAAENPDAVERIALIAPAGVFSSRRRLAYVLPLLRAVGRNPRRIALAVRDVLRIGPHRLWRVGSDLLHADVLPVLPRVRAPALVIWGANDPVLPPSLGTVFSDELPDGRLVILERAAHVPMLEAPEELNEELLRFFAERADDPR